MTRIHTTPSESAAHTTSDELLARARRVVPGASQTVSKSPAQWVQGVAPVFAARAAGPYVWDVEGRRYFDLPLALGPMILGHGHPEVVAAVRNQVAEGVTFTLPHALEVEVAERIVQLVPGAEMVRFGKSGSDATTAAVRAARAITRRDRVASCGYHGWHDWHISTTTRSAGIPDAVRALSHTFAFNDLASLDRLLAAYPSEFAALVLEPAGAQEPEPGFLDGVRERADASGALLVFDEIITGFRLALGGAQEHYGVEADFVCFGKALGNGLPVSAVVGPENLMTVFEEEVFFSGTHAGEVVSLAAAKATLDVLVREDVPAGLWRRGEELRQRIDAAVTGQGLDGHVTAGGAAPRIVVAVFEPDPQRGQVARTFLQQELLKRGVLFNGSNFMCHAHTQADIEEIAGAYEEALSLMAGRWPDGLSDALEGPVLAPVFREP